MVLGTYHVQYVQNLCTSTLGFIYYATETYIMHFLNAPVEAGHEVNGLYGPGLAHRHTQKRLLTKTTVFYVVHEVNARGVRAAQKCSKIIQDKI